MPPKLQYAALGAELVYGRTILLYDVSLSGSGDKFIYFIEDDRRHGLKKLESGLSIGEAIKGVMLRIMATKLLRMPIPSIPNPILLLERQFLRLLSRKLNIRTLNPRLLHHTCRAFIPNTPK